MTSRQLRTNFSSWPRDGGFYLLHPSDCRAYTNHVRAILYDPESFQLWCVHKTAICQEILRLLEDLEYNPAARPTGKNHNCQHPCGTTKQFIWINEISKLRRSVEGLFQIVKPYRFAHHRPTHYPKPPPDFQYQLVRLTCQQPDDIPHEHPTRSRSALARQRSWARTALPFDDLMLRRGLRRQFDPASDSDYNRKEQMPRMPFHHRGIRIPMFLTFRSHVSVRSR